MKLNRSFRSLLLILCLTVPSAAIAIPVEAQQNGPRTAGEQQLIRTLTVTGEGKQSLETTLTQVQLGVEVQGKTAQEAQREAAKRSSAVVEFLRSRNVDKLQTTGISLNPQYNYANNQQRLIGYSATNTVSFRIPTERAGDLLDQAVAAGATRIDSVSFIADDAAIETARQQAIRAAVQNAQAQAEVTLGSLGLKQQEIVGVQVNGTTPPPPILYRRADVMEARAASASTPVVGGEQEVQASVTLQIRY